ncbi:hypothetical protein L195_g063438, partial [Trifolium pratense]
STRKMSGEEAVIAAEPVAFSTVGILGEPMDTMTELPCNLCLGNHWHTRWTCA